MTILAVHLIEIPAQLWAEWPVDRPLAHLAQDALAFERRIKKGVNTPQERRRYVQVCEAIETNAAQLVAQRRAATTLQFHDRNAEAYLSLVERAQPLTRSELVTAPLPSTLVERLKTFGRAVFGLPGAYKTRARTTVARAHEEVALAWASLWKTRRSATEVTSKRTHPIGKSFHPPGECVAEQHALFEAIAVRAVHTLWSDSSADIREQMAHVAWEKARFCAAAERRGSAVVERLSYDFRGGVK